MPGDECSAAWSTATLSPWTPKPEKVIWDVVGAGNPGEFYSSAPIFSDGRLYIGNAGSDYGAIGHIRAFDVDTGKMLCNFDTVASTEEAARTWPDIPGKDKAGGGTYSSYALDTQTGLLYSPVGNPGPDFVRDYRISVRPRQLHCLRCGQRPSATQDLHDPIGGGVITYMLDGMQ